MNNPQIIIQDGVPRAVILDIEQYEALLEKAEQVDDIRALHEAKRRPLEFTSLEDYLRDRDEGVSRSA